ncbi:MAG: hypothetical protein AAB359_01815, partial [Elusimicrobiota bacterium]
MTGPGQIKYRLAMKEDIPALLKLFRLAAEQANGSPAPQDTGKILAEMQSENSILFAAEKGKDIVAVIFVLSDHNHGLCKIYRMYADAVLEGAQEILKGLLFFTVERFKNSAFRPDVLYTTTRTLTPRQQEFTLELGFKLLGIFPVPGQSPGGLNGLT